MLSTSYSQAGGGRDYGLTLTKGTLKLSSWILKFTLVTGRGMEGEGCMEGDGRGWVYGGGREKGGGEEVEGKEEGRGGREEGDGWRG